MTTTLNPPAVDSFLQRAPTVADRVTNAGTRRSETVPWDEAVQSSGAWRYELKYLVGRESRAGLLHDLAALSEADRHAGLDGSYRVRTLYLDSPDAACYHDKIDGVPDRFRLRVRGYFVGDRLVSTVKFEIKERRGERMRKHVVAVPEEGYRELSSVLRSFRFPRNEWLHLPVLARFFRLKQVQAFRPVLVVEYVRRAFLPRTHSGCRITFDETLEAWSATELLHRKSSGGGLLRPYRGIFEIKTPGTIPAWVAELIRKYRLGRQAASKYAMAAESLGIAADGDL